MAKLQRGNRTLIKAMNRSLVLNTLRREQRLSRTQLTELSGLSVGAVSHITNELLANNWIMEVGEGDYTGGRRQTLLKLNPQAGCAVGIKLMEDRVVGAITDLESRVLYSDVWHTIPDHNPQSVSHLLKQFISDIVAKSTNSDHCLMGVGIGLAGAIDPHAGIVHSSPFFGWRDVPLASLLEAQLHIPVFIENDVTTLSFAEQLFGPGQHTDNFMVITVGRGIGLGIVINSEVYQGTRGGAGEIGHITLDPTGPRCDCGKNGCLEALAADPAVIEYVRMGLTQRGEPDDALPQTLIDVVNLARDGHSLAREALARSGRYLGIGIATAVNLLCPSLVILSGEGIVAGDFRLQPMFEALREHTFNGLLKDVEVVVQPLDDQTWARGAASLVISRVFESPSLDSVVPT